MDRESIIAEKRKLRRQILTIRDQMPEEDRYRESEEIRRRLRGVKEYSMSGKLLAYANFGSELFTEGIIEDALADGKEVYLPRVMGEQMRFYRICSVSELVKGYKGIREPEPSEDKALGFLDGEKAFMLLPGVVFDKKGGRIGYGKGFYDRFLQKYHEKLTVCGAALGCQILDQGTVPMEETDFPLEYLLFAKGCLNFGASHTL